MSELSDFLEDCYTEAAAAIGTVPIKCGTRTGAGIVSPFMATREQRDSGFWRECTTTAELSRTAATALQIDDRSELLISTRKFRVMRIEDDPHDVSIRYYLKPV